MPEIPKKFSHSKSPVVLDPTIQEDDDEEEEEEEEDTDHEAAEREEEVVVIHRQKQQQQPNKEKKAPPATEIASHPQSLGTEYDEKLLPSINNEVLKTVVAQFNADQLLTERPHVSELVRDLLVRRARDFNIVLDDVAITHRRR